MKIFLLKKIIVLFIYIYYNSEILRIIMLTKNLCCICKKKLYFSIDLYFSYNHKKLKECFVNKKYISIIEE